jgi:hypothetical protein
MEDTLSFISFTNKTKLFDLDYRHDDLELFWEEHNLELSQKLPFVLIDSNTTAMFCTKVPEILADFDMILVYDCFEKPDSEFLKMLSEIFAKLESIAFKQFSVIHHRNQHNKILNCIKDFGKSNNVTLRESMHISDDVSQNYYYRVTIDKLITTLNKSPS